MVCDAPAGDVMREPKKKKKTGYTSYSDSHGKHGLVVEQRKG
jgi:hypothetical protein